MSRQGFVANDLKNVIEKIIRQTLFDLDKVAVGKIITFNSEKYCVDVEILQKKKISSQQVAYPILRELPVITLIGGRTKILMPIQEGDIVLVLFADRGTDEVLNGATSTYDQKDTGRNHNINDGFVLAGFNLFVNDINGGNYLKFNDNGDLETNMKVITTNDVVYMEGGVGVSLKNHTHRYIDNIGQPPVPTPSETDPPTSEANPLKYNGNRRVFFDDGV